MKETRSKQPDITPGHVVARLLDRPSSHGRPRPTILNFSGSSPRLRASSRWTGFTSRAASPRRSADVPSTFASIRPSLKSWRGALSPQGTADDLDQRHDPLPLCGPAPNGPCDSVEAWEGTYSSAVPLRRFTRRSLFRREHVLGGRTDAIEDLPRPSGMAIEVQGISAPRHAIHDRTPEVLRRSRRAQGSVRSSARESHSFAKSRILRIMASQGRLTLLASAPVSGRQREMDRRRRLANALLLCRRVRRGDVRRGLAGLQPNVIDGVLDRMSPGLSQHPAVKMRRIFGPSVISSTSTKVVVFGASVSSRLLADARRYLASAPNCTVSPI